MAKIKKKLKVQSIIEDQKVLQKPRKYIGFSMIGEKCPRSIWYTWRLCSRIYHSPRQLRIFQRGHNEEPIIRKDLEKAGIVCHSDQKEIKILGGWIQGHCDGIAEKVPDAPKTPHLLEYKALNEKSLNDLKKRGVKDSKPVYYGQIACYMKFLKLSRCLFIAVNKNTDERYYERVKEDKEHSQYLVQRAKDIMVAKTPPPRIGQNPEYFECKHFCNHYQVCFQNEPFEKTCRSCQHIEFAPRKGGWICHMKKIMLTFEQQLKGNQYCKNYQ